MPYSYPFPRPAVTVDVAPFALRGGKLRILLVRRARAPFKGRWALPGGFVGMEERLAQAAARELREETGVAATWLEALGAYGDPGRDPRGRTVTIVFLAAIGPGAAVRAASDAAAAQWRDPRRPPPLAFDHGIILRDALAELRRRARYEAALLAFVPAPFTLAELRACAEAVLGERLDARRFAARLSKMKLLRLVARGRHRPAAGAWRIAARCGGIVGPPRLSA